ncbi:ABC transporter permease [Candidatus Gracilibacteria bacterium]|nr:ABC transporter permease [Candidatus Gracilibacteria bacterium]
MNNPLGTWTLFKRENARFMKVYIQTILAPVVSNLLFLTIFGLSLRSAVVSIEGVGYLEFIVPGLILMGIINNSYQNPSSSLIITKYQGRIADLLTIPLKSGEILLAMIGSALLRGLTVGLITYLTALYFVDFTYPSLTAIFTGGILVSLFFSFLGVFMGIWADEFDKTAFITNFVLMPLTFLGGVFYPITTLPDVFQTISQANPIVYMVNIFRYGFTGIEEISLTTSYIIVITMVVSLGILDYYLLKKGWKLQD